MVLEQAEAAATLFELQQNADSGVIFVQEPFSVEIEDDATSVERKVLDALRRALDAWLPRMLVGERRGRVQNEAEATWYGKRTSDDGLIQWSDSAAHIVKLIRATTRPHPGAFTFHGLDRIRIWKCELSEDDRFRGVVGRVLAANEEGHLLVQSGTASLWLTEYEVDSRPGMCLKVGDKMGYDVELEIHHILKVLARSHNLDHS